MSKFTDQDYRDAISEEDLTTPPSTGFTKEDYQQAVSDEHPLRVPHPPNTPKPDDFIKTRKLSKQTGLSIPTVERNKKEIEQKEFERTAYSADGLDDAPHTLEAFNKPDLAPAIAGDQQGLAEIEREENVFQQTRNALFHAVADPITGGIEAFQAVPGGVEQSTRTVRISDLNNKLFYEGGLNAAEQNDLTLLELRQNDEILPHIKGWPQAMAQTLPMWLTAAARSGEEASMGFLGGMGTGAAVGLAGGPAAPVSAPAAAFTGAVVGTGVGLRIGTAKNFGLIERGGAVGEYKNIKDIYGNPLSDDDIRLAGNIYAVTGGLFEFAGASFITKLAKPIPGLGKWLSGGMKEPLKDLLRQGISLKGMPAIAGKITMGILGEGGTELAQAMSQSFIGELQQVYKNKQLIKEGKEPAFRPFAYGDGKQGFEGWWNENWPEWKIEGYQGAKAGGGMVTASTVAQGAMNIAVEAHVGNQQAKMEQEHIVRLRDSIMNNETFKKDPETFIEATQGSLGTNILIDAGDFQTLYQSNPDEFAELVADVPEILEQMEEAVELGADLVLPTNKTMASLAKDSNEQVFEALQKELKHTASAVTDKQMKDIMQNEVLQEAEAATRSQTQIEELSDPQRAEFNNLQGMSEAEFEEQAVAHTNTVAALEIRIGALEETDPKAAEALRPQLEALQQTQTLIGLAREERVDAFGQQIEGRVRQMGLDSGRTTEVAEQEAIVARTQYQARARKAQYDPAVMDEMHTMWQKLGIQSGIPAVREQTELNNLIKQVRSGKAPTDQQIYGNRSLLQTLKAEGFTNITEADPEDQGGANYLDDAAYFASQNGFIENYDTAELQAAMEQEQGGEPVYSLLTANEELYKQRRQVDAVNAAIQASGKTLADFSDSQLRQFIMGDDSQILNQSSVPRNYTQNGVSFTQDFGDKVIRSDESKDGSVEDIPAQKMFTDLKERRQALDKLVDCLT